MSDLQWENLKEIFHAAVDLPSGERAAYLDKACEGNQSLRSAVDSLIRSHEGTRHFIDSPAFQVAAEMLLDDHEFKAGDLISHYEIRSVLGEGGMGKVYLAQDTKLERKVALKILPQRLATNQEHMHRFIQEAKTAAGLHHPNIAQIFEIGEQDHTRYIAMEYVAGETLRQLLSGRKIETKRAVELAAQVASGLSAAHREGVIHRDIKPDNLIVTGRGEIKILDFGLAKLIERQREGGGVNELTTAVRASTDVTTPGVIMGTVAYMSPEQARGEKVDQRSDIFSLGVVLYEMVTGQRPFKGKSAVDTLHAIINLDPLSVAHSNSRMPAELTDILAKALAKDASERYQHAGDFELDLRRFKRAIESNTLVSSQARPASQGLTHGFTIKWLVVFALLITAAAFGGWWFGHSGAVPGPPVELHNLKLAPLTSDPGYEGEPTFAPNGETIAYVADRSGNLDIYLKQISGGADINLTNNPADDVQPAFSPDGKQIAFISTRSSLSSILYFGYDLPLMGGDLWVMPALGGGTRRIAGPGNFPSWSPDGSTIIYTSGPQRRQKIYQVSASGGEPREIPLKFKAGDPPHRFLLYPSFSSDGEWIVFEADVTTDNVIYVVNAEGGEPKRLARGKRPTWNANTHAIVYSNTEAGKNQSLWQLPFSTSTGELSGSPTPLTVGRGRDTQSAVSRDGKSIAFTALNLSFNVEVLPFDAESGRPTGDAQQVTSGSDIVYFMNFSPDARSVVFESHRGASSHIWRVDLGAPAVQLTTDPNFNDLYPRWSPDGGSVVFLRRPSNDLQASGSLWLMTADGANPQRLIENVGPFSYTWMPDGKAIIYFSPVDSQFYSFDMQSRSARRLTNESNISFIPAVSPDGKWLIYQSTQSGNIDLRAMPTSGGDSKVVVATPHHDFHPSISPTGRWLYFQLDHKNLYRVPGPAQDWRQSSPEKITNYPDSNLFLEDPQLSRDGRQLLYARGRITGDIWILSFVKD